MSALELLQQQYAHMQTKAALVGELATVNIRVTSAVLMGETYWTSSSADAKRSVVGWVASRMACTTISVPPSCSMTTTLHGGHCPFAIIWQMQQRAIAPKVSEDITDLCYSGSDSPVKGAHVCAV